MRLSHRQEETQTKKDVIAMPLVRCWASVCGRSDVNNNEEEDSVSVLCLLGAAAEIGS